MISSDGRVSLVVCVFVAFGIVLAACSRGPAVFYGVPELSARREAVRGAVKVAGVVRQEPKTRSGTVTFDLFAQNRDPVSVPVVFAKADFPGLSAEDLDGRSSSPARSTEKRSTASS